MKGTANQEEITIINIYEPDISTPNFILKKKTRFKNTDSQVQVAHACNLSYLEAEIRRIMVQSQPGKIVCKTAISKITRAKNGLKVWLMW
jgi:hypothetical protein